MKLDNKFKRKRIRIKDFNYIGAHAYFITICTFDKHQHFGETKIVNNLLYYLKQEAARFSYSVYAYCFMKDHLHLLLIGSEESNLIKFIRIFKQKTGYYFKQQTGKLLWQRSYFERVLRKKEDINNIAGYIFNNPVRKKLVDDFRKYPYLGSFVIDINDYYNLYSQMRNLDLNLIFQKQ